MKQNRVVNLPRSNFFGILLIACTDQLSDQRSGSMWYTSLCVHACERENTSEGRSKGGKKTKKVIMAASRLDHPSSIHQSSPINKFNKWILKFEWE